MCCPGIMFQTKSEVFTLTPQERRLALLTGKQLQKYPLYASPLRTCSEYSCRTCTDGHAGRPFVGSRKQSDRKAFLRFYAHMKQCLQGLVSYNASREEHMASIQADPPKACEPKHRQTLRKRAFFNSRNSLSWHVWRKTERQHVLPGLTSHTSLPEAMCLQDEKVERLCKAVLSFRFCLNVQWTNWPTQLHNCCTFHTHKYSLRHTRVAQLGVELIARKDAE